VEQCPVHRCSLPSGMMKSKPFLQNNHPAYKRRCEMVKKILVFFGLSLSTWLLRMADDDHPARFPRDATFTTLITTKFR